MATGYLLTAGEQRTVRTPRSDLQVGWCPRAGRPRLAWRWDGAPGQDGPVPACRWDGAPWRGWSTWDGFCAQKHVLNTCQPGAVKELRTAATRNPVSAVDAHTLTTRCPAPSCRQMRADCTLDGQVDSCQRGCELLLFSYPESFLSLTSQVPSC